MHSGPSFQLSAYCSSADSEIFRHFNHSVHCATWPRSLGGKTALKIAGKRYSWLWENGTQGKEKCYHAGMMSTYRPRLIGSILGSDQYKMYNSLIFIDNPSVHDLSPALEYAFYYQKRHCKKCHLF